MVIDAFHGREQKIEQANGYELATKKRQYHRSGQLETGLGAHSSESLDAL